MILIVLILGVLMGVWGYNVGKNRSIGGVGGAFLALFFGFIGIIILYCLRKKEVYEYEYYDYERPYEPGSAADEIEQLKHQLNNGVISQEEYNNQKSQVLGR